MNKDKLTPSQIVMVFLMTISVVFLMVFVSIKTNENDEKKKNPNTYVATPIPMTISAAGSSVDRFGLPYEIVIHEEDFTLAYDGRTRQARWVAELINREKLTDKKGKRENSKFFEDDRIPVEFRADLDDYVGTGFDRGHLAPAGDHGEDQKSIDSTFTLANMSPQLPEFNRGYWRHVETLVRDLALTDGIRELVVITGPIFETDRFFEDLNGKTTIGKNKVAIPTGYFKTIAVVHEDNMIEIGAYKFRHDELKKIGVDRVKMFCLSVDDLEREVGLDFWNGIEVDESQENHVLGKVEE